MPTIYILQELDLSKHHVVGAVKAIKLEITRLYIPDQKSKNKFVMRLFFNTNLTNSQISLFTKELLDFIHQKLQTTEFIKPTSFGIDKTKTYLEYEVSSSFLRQFRKIHKEIFKSKKEINKH